MLLSTLPPNSSAPQNLKIKNYSALLYSYVFYIVLHQLLTPSSFYSCKCAPSATTNRLLMTFHFCSIKRFSGRGGTRVNELGLSSYECACALSGFVVQRTSNVNTSSQRRGMCEARRRTLGTRSKGEKS